MANFAKKKKGGKKTPSPWVPKPMGNPTTVPLSSPAMPMGGYVYKLARLAAKDLID